MALPPVLYDACDRQASRVSSLSLVRYHIIDDVQYLAANGSD